MSDAEVADFLAASKTVTCATIARDGRPHLMPLWYVLRGGELWSWTYAKSQKVRNLERDARCTLQVEGGTEYTELRGVMLDCDAVIHRELEDVAALGAEIAAQAAKRVGLQFVERRRVSWDHRKLGGTY
jgi:nitroimidazol reductase NimA-like FMN-containing flavoprotein (pyridoxamine 5'-phosphate oxidase superfamily)